MTFCNSNSNLPPPLSFAMHPEPIKQISTKLSASNELLINSTLYIKDSVRLEADSVSPKIYREEKNVTMHTQKKGIF